jgi:hypothetical protein
VEQKREKKTAQRPASEARPLVAETLENPTRGLDFAKLDLSVERVEERISPSETNVFDK